MESVGAGYNHTCAVTASGNIYCWGRGDLGPLGDNNTTIHYVGVPSRVLRGGASVVSTDNNGTNLINVESVSNGSSYTCAITASGNLYCWGQGDYGALGDNNTTPHNVATPFRVFAGGSEEVEIAGDNNGSHLANVKQVSSGSFHTCAVTASGNLYCWGNGSFGRLGNNSNTNVATPSRVLQGGASAVSTDNNGANLVNVSSVSAGIYNTCAVTASGNLYCWGRGDSGQLGDNSTASHSVSTPFRVLQGDASAVSTDNNGTN